MKFDLSRFHGTLKELDRRFEPAAFNWPDEPFALAGPVVLKAEVRKDGAKFRVAGRVETVLECDCSRCAEPYQVPVDSTFDLLYLPASANAGDGEQEVDADDLDAAYYHDEEIDLGELVREQCYLVLPMKPLCTDDCLGLCPSCGVNRNTGTCSCENTWTDPRLDALRRLREGS